MRINVNGAEHDLGDIDPSTPLLWVLRDHLNRDASGDFVTPPGYVFATAPLCRGRISV